MSSTHESIVFWQEIVFTVIFCVDIVLKLFAMGPCFYFTRKWNMFDFFVVSVQVSKCIFLMNESGLLCRWSLSSPLR